MEMIYVEKFTDKAALTANYIEFFDNNLSVTCVGYNDFHDIQPYEKNRVQKVYSLHFVLSGQGVFEIYGKRHKVGEQDMFLIPPNETVCYYPDRNDPWVYIWVDFVGDNAETLMKRLGFGEASPYMACDSPYSLYSVVKKFFTRLESSGEMGYFAALSLFYSIMDINTKSEKLRARTLRDQVLSYIDNHYSDSNLKISEICSFFNISHSYLCDLFKDGNTVKEILTAKRLEEAKRLLYEGDLFIEEVGRSVGFTNASHFMKVFKKQTGMSAGEYRRLARTRRQPED